MSPRIISHRGKIDLSSPENDLGGIEEAINLGVDMVEFDVRKTSDDVLVCHHDAEVNGISVSNLTYESLKISNDQLCKLDEVILLCKGKVGVNLEIKEEGFETRVVDMLATYFSYENIYVTSFLPSVIRNVKCLDSKIISGLLLESCSASADASRVRALELIGKLEGVNAFGSEKIETSQKVTLETTEEELMSSIAQALNDERITAMFNRDK